MELPFHLRTLEPLPGALDILRLFGSANTPTLDADIIMDELGLSERSFNKAVRRLVTKGYMQMDGDLIYRLSDQGQSAVSELQEYDASNEVAQLAEPSAPTQPTAAPASFAARRRLLVGVPQPLAAEQPAELRVGFAESGAEEAEPVDMVVRVTVVNGEPSTPQDLVFVLDEAATWTAAQITPDRQTPVRVKLEAYQLNGEMGEIVPAGGMYIDVPVVEAPASVTLAAYGIDITLTP